MFWADVWSVYVTEAEGRRLEVQSPAYSPQPTEVTKQAEHRDN